ncbi:hypothetical protein QJQ45_012042 [Haematococcus lacustris]|nr:hypothetical protein QJQ45_012042 [Haematococcus lacustris]
MVDLGDRHAVMRALAHAKPLPSLVMHFAAVAYVAESMADPVLYYKNITSTTTFLLDVMRELGIKQVWRPPWWLWAELLVQQQLGPRARSHNTWRNSPAANSPGATAQRPTALAQQPSGQQASTHSLMLSGRLWRQCRQWRQPMQREWPVCQLLVYSSTCAVYGNQEVLPITELSPPKPINPYGEAKLMAERVINAAMKADSGLQAIILRYFNVYGSDPQGRLGEGEWPRPELRHHSRISGACLDAAMGLVPSVTIKGTQHPTADGSCVRDYVHVSDLVEAHLRAIQHLDNPAPVLNIGSGHPVSVKQFQVAACKNVTGRDFKVVEQAEARQGDYAEVWAKIDRIQEAFEWSPRYTDVAEGLRHAWQWRLRHPQGYEKHSDDSMADGHDIS